MASTSAAKKTADMIASAGIFTDLSKKQFGVVEKLITPVEVKAGKDLTAEGSRGRECGVLLDGSATVTIDGEVVATLQPGDHYGEMALLDEAGSTGAARTATVTAVDDQLVAVMSVVEFRAVMAEFPEIAGRLREAAQRRAAENDTVG